MDGEVGKNPSRAVRSSQGPSSGSANQSCWMEKAGKLRCGSSSIWIPCSGLSPKCLLLVGREQYLPLDRTFALISVQLFSCIVYIVQVKKGNEKTRKAQIHTLLTDSAPAHLTRGDVCLSWVRSWRQAYLESELYYVAEHEFLPQGSLRFIFYCGRNQSNKLVNTFFGRFQALISFSLIQNSQGIVLHQE